MTIANWWPWPGVAVVLFGLLVGLAPTASGAAEAERFPTPEAAADALLAAVGTGEPGPILAIFGEGAEDVIFTGETGRDRALWETFVERAEALSRVAIQADGMATLYIGQEQWPFPVPISENQDGWAFDVAAARDEILYRRIGRNELDVIALAEAYVQAQSEYRQIDHDDDGVMEFAASLLSSESAEDGLYYPTSEVEPPSPLGPLIALAVAEGFSVDGEDQPPEPYHGYFYRILTAQGEAAPGGAYDYQIGDNMVAGHALVAFPADYGNSGVMTFLVSENGIVLEADLGEDTLDAALAIEAYEPDDRWTPAE